jgi:hypothetical protein
MGVLLGLPVIWLVFDHIWPVPALKVIRGTFARNVRLMGRLAVVLDRADRAAALEEIEKLREAIHGRFSHVEAEVDNVRFELSSARDVDLRLTEKILNWQASVRNRIPGATRDTAVPDSGRCEPRAFACAQGRPGV